MQPLFYITIQYVPCFWCSCFSCDKHVMNPMHSCLFNYGWKEQTTGVHIKTMDVSQDEVCGFLACAYKYSYCIMMLIYTVSYFLKMNLNFKACILTNIAPNNEMLFIHKQSHNSFWLKHFVNELILRPLRFLATLYANQCHCWMLVINLNPWIKYSPACSTTKCCTPFSIMAHNTIHMNYDCLTSWQQRLLASDGEKYMRVVICTISVQQQDVFDTIRHFNRPVRQRFSPQAI